jgi:transcriptional regulator
VYVPPAFRIDDQAVLHDFISRHGFATLVSVADGVPFASHLPLLLEGGVLKGHMARGNPQWRTFGAADVLAIFTGPHGYISPTWYEVRPAVPTWNYAAVHVYGQARVVEEFEWVSDTVDRLVAKYEAGQPRPWDGSMPEEYRRKMLAGVVGFEVAVSRIEGKYKLSQNRSEADRRGVVRQLAAGDAEDRALAEFMRGAG